MRLLIFIVAIVNLKTPVHEKEDIKSYPVKRVAQHPILDGQGNDPAWNAAPLLTDFQYPWERDRPLLTIFKAIHDEEWLYCFFDVTDPSVHIENKTGSKDEVAASSRAEIFFKADDNMNPYYCLEIDPDGRVLDYEAFYHRKFDFKWAWPNGGIVIRTHKRDDGYSMEIAISKRSLLQLGLLKNNTLQAGLYRADCTIQAGMPEFKWISWLRPDSDTPDFHIPSSFGILRLEE